MLIFSFIPAFALYIDHYYNKQIPFLTSTTKFIVDIPVQLNNLFARKLTGYEADVKYDKDIRSALKKTKNNVLGSNYTKPMYLLSSGYDDKVGQTVVDVIDLNSFELKKKIIPDFKEIKKYFPKDNIYYNKIIAGHQKLHVQNPIICSDTSMVLLCGGIVKLDYHGDIKWLNAEKKFHHSLTIDHEGNIWSPSRNFPFTIKNVKHRTLFFDDAITALSPKGQIIFDRSLVNIFFQNGLGYKLFENHGYKTLKKDPFHLNDIEPVIEDTDYWKKGDLFLSIRNLSMVMLYRPSKDSVVWYIEGLTNHQHDVDIIDSSRISIFNNDAINYRNNSKIETNNKITIYDFKTREHSNYLTKSLEKYNVRTATQGLHTILDHGELYIEETDNGRHLFFDKNGDLVWQMFNFSKEKDMVFKYNWSELIFKSNQIVLLEKFLF